MTTGELIKRYRLLNHLTQKQLGELCLMPDSQIRQYESGRIIPKLDTLQRIAAALNVSYAALLPYQVEGTESAPAAMDPDIESLLSNYGKLNSQGREKVKEYTADLAGNSAYRKRKS